MCFITTLSIIVLMPICDIIQHFAVHIPLQPHLKPIIVVVVKTVARRCQLGISTIEAEWRIHVSEQFTIIDLDNGLSLVRCHDIIWITAVVLSLRPYETNFCEMLF